MPWIRFTKDFDFSPAARKGFVTIAYKAGMLHNVTTPCARVALAANRAVRANRPKADEDTQPKKA